MGKRKEYRKIIKNYKEQKIVFQEEMKLDYSKLEETIAEAIKIEKERENERIQRYNELDTKDIVFKTKKYKKAVEVENKALEKPKTYIYQFEYRQGGVSIKMPKNKHFDIFHKYLTNLQS